MIINKPYIKSFLCSFLILSAYSLGVITVEYQTFPFEQLRSLKSAVSGKVLTNYKRPEYLYWTDMFNTIYEAKEVDVVMLGDSITHRVNWSELLNKNTIVNRGINGDITEGLLNRLANIIQLSPKKVFIMGGINDLSYEVEIDAIYSNYISIVTTLKRHGIEVFIQSTLFTSRDKLNKGVKILNKKLEAYAFSNDIVFINLNAKLSNNGRLMDDYTTDGVHLNPQGYNLWKEELRAYIK